MMLVFLKQFLPSSVAFPNDVRAVMSQYTVYGAATGAATGAALIAAGVAGAGKPFCRQPKGKAFSKAPAIPGRFFLDFPKSGQFRTGKGKIAAIRSQTFWKVTRLQQSGAKHFWERQDCGNPEPNTSGNDRIAAIRNTARDKGEYCAHNEARSVTRKKFSLHHCRQSDEFS